MHFSRTAILALPLLAAAAQEQSPLDYAKEQAQNIFNKISSFLPNPNTQHPVEAAAAKAGALNINVLNINNWKSTIQPNTRTYGDKPDEWWVLFTGGNKTCYGQCTRMETAFNASAAALAVVPSAPNLALVNCDHQPILCNSWAAGPPELWILEVSAPGTPVDVRINRMNMTSATVKDFTDLHSSRSWVNKPKYEGYFHPFDGPIAKLGLAQPIGYIIWGFSVIPSWAFMIGVSFLSRTIMSVLWKEPARRN